MSVGQWAGKSWSVKLQRCSNCQVSNPGNPHAVQGGLDSRIFFQTSNFDDLKLCSTLGTEMYSTFLERSKSPLNFEEKLPPKRLSLDKIVQLSNVWFQYVNIMNTEHYLHKWWIQHWGLVLLGRLKEQKYVKEMDKDWFIKFFG